MTTKDLRRLVALRIDDVIADLERVKSRVQQDKVDCRFHFQLVDQKVPHLRKALLEVDKNRKVIHQIGKR